MTPEVKRLDTEEQYLEARRAMFALGFLERSEMRVPGHMSSVFEAPDGYVLRLVYDVKSGDPS